MLIIIASSARAQATVDISEQTVKLKDGVYYLHTVKRKQTLFSIARVYNVDQQTIIDKNPSLNTTELQIRQTLLIPTPETYRKLTAPPEQPKESKQERFEQLPPAAPQSTIVPLFQQETAPDENSETDQQSTLAGGKPVINAPGYNEPINIVALMPFTDERSTMNENSADFIKGTLFAVDQLKAKGVNINLKLMSTGANITQTENLINNGKLDGANLIIGPVYAENFAMVAKWAMQNRVPVISPLATVEGIQNPYVVQFPPQAANKYDKIRSLILDPHNNVVMVNHTQYNDTAAYREFSQIVPLGIPTVNYNRSSSISELSTKMDKERNNVIIVPVSHQGSLEDILSKISSLNSPMKRYDIQVVGTTRWRTLLNDVNPELFFRNNVTYPSSYYADRSNADVSKFYNDYMSAFSNVPTLFSMRGYDITMVMVKAIKEFGNETLTEMTSTQMRVLQMPYKFQNNGSSITNDQWVTVTHTPEYKIVVQ